MQQPRSATSKAEQIKPEGALGRVLRVYKAYSHNVVGNQLVMIGFSIAVFLLLVAAAADIIAPASPFATVPVNALMGPREGAWFGSDQLGRDVLSRVIHGSRVSLGVAFVSICIAIATGGTLGLIGGYFGELVDNVIGRFMDILFGLPTILLAVAITASLGPGMNNAIAAIGIAYAPLFSRVARAAALAERNREYVDAARVLGASHRRILLRHIVPNALSPIIVQASVSFSFAIILEAALSYLGLGTQPPLPSWGTMLAEGRRVLELAPWLSIFPGMAIMLAVLAFNLVGDGLRDILDPRMR
ncbi:MAG: ABC transporter permease [Chloroflexota bacterium]